MIFTKFHTIYNDRNLDIFEKKINIKQILYDDKPKTKAMEFMSIFNVIKKVVGEKFLFLSAQKFLFCTKLNKNRKIEYNLYLIDIKNFTVEKN